MFFSKIFFLILNKKSSQQKSLLCCCLFMLLLVVAFFFTDSQQRIERTTIASRPHQSVDVNIAYVRALWKVHGRSRVVMSVKSTPRDQIVLDFLHKKLCDSLSRYSFARTSEYVRIQRKRVTRRAKRLQRNGKLKDAGMNKGINAGLKRSTVVTRCCG